MQTFVCSTHSDALRTSYGIWLQIQDFLHHTTGDFRETTFCLFLNDLINFDEACSMKYQGTPVPGGHLVKEAGWSTILD